MFEKTKNFCIENKKSIAVCSLALGIGLIAIDPVSAYAAGASLLDPVMKTEVTTYGADIAATQLDVLKVIVPAGLGMWGVGFAVKKGLNTLQKKAGKAL